MNETCDVVIIGAGLAGLACAIDCVRQGLTVRVFESSDRAGGRVRTDLVDGYRLDRGFQVLNTGYPALSRYLDLEELDIRPFVPGAAIFSKGKLNRLVNPLLDPRGIVGDLTAPVGGVVGKVLLALTSAVVGAPPDSWLQDALRRLGPGRDTDIRTLLSRGHVGSAMEQSFIRPFLAGVLLDPDLSTSSARLGLIIWRSFVRGRIGVPAQGMGQIATQMSGLLPAGTLEVNSRVSEILGLRPGETPGVVLEEGRVVNAPAVVVATEAPVADQLVPGGKVCSTPMRSVTTFWHRAPSAPLTDPVLVLDSEGDLIVNSIVMSNASREYLGPRGGALVATSVLGSHRDPETERSVTRRLSELYSTDTAQWDLLAAHPIDHALPAFPPGRTLRRKVSVRPGLWVCGDHMDTPSIQGALVSGGRTASSVVTALRKTRS